MLICVSVIYVSFRVILKQWKPNDLTLVDPKECKPDELEEAVVHENVHHDQMKSGRLDYDQNCVTWKPTTRSHLKTFSREQMREGSDDLEWEAEAYKESDKFKKQQNDLA